MLQPMVELWTIQEVSEALKVSKHTLYKWVAARTIPYVKVGAATRFEPVRIQEWLNSHHVIARSDE
jgi:excisionase family DNA binding protein